jgi:hypothetical protein
MAHQAFDVECSSADPATVCRNVIGAIHALIGQIHPLSISDVRWAEDEERVLAKQAILLLASR